MSNSLTLNQGGIKYTRNHVNCKSWKSKENDVKIGTVRFIDKKLCYLNFISKKFLRKNECNWVDIDMVKKIETRWVPD